MYNTHSGEAKTLLKASIQALSNLFIQYCIQYLYFVKYEPHYWQVIKFLLTKSALEGVDLWEGCFLFACIKKSYAT